MKEGTRYQNFLQCSFFLKKKKRITTRAEPNQCFGVMVSEWNVGGLVHDIAYMHKRLFHSNEIPEPCVLHVTHFRGPISLSAESLLQPWLHSFTFNIELQSFPKRTNKQRPTINDRNRRRISPHSTDRSLTRKSVGRRKRNERPEKISEPRRFEVWCIGNGQYPFPTTIACSSPTALSERCSPRLLCSVYGLKPRRTVRVSESNKRF